jgi:CubicO group peptidase (beta-lactamase class C family)
MPKVAPSAVALFVAVSLLAGAQTRTERGNDRKVEAAVDSYLRPYVEGKNFTGAVLLARKRRVLLEKGYGQANYELGVANTPQTRFHIASVSKPFTSTAILLLQERGKVKTSDPLAKFIPDYPNGDKITLRHLLTHTSGIPNVNNFPDYDEFARTRHTVAELVAKFRDKPLEFQPGEKYSYSNSNYNLLAYVIEKVSGEAYGDFLKKNIFDPLAMTSSGHDGDATLLIPNRASGYEPVGADALQNAAFLDWSNKTGNGSLYSTVHDLYKFDRAFYSDQLLNKRSRDEMFAEGEGIHYGWSTRKQLDRRAISINGRSPGFNASLLRFVDDDVCVVVLSNSYSPASQTAIAGDLAKIIFGEKPSPPPRLEAVSDNVAKTAVGRYQFGPDYFRPNAVVDIEHDGNHLFMKWEDGKRSVLLALQSGKFIDRMYWGQVEFSNEPGKALQLTYSPVGSFVAKRTER